jgi:hypothetical protein
MPLLPSTFFAKPSIIRARQEVARLLRAPEQLRIQCKRVLNERIPNLESSIEHETGKGIHMTDLASTLEELGQQIDTVCPQLRLDARVSPEHLDKMTQEFEDAVELLEKLESKVKNIHKCRINIDQQMEEAGKHSRSIVDSIAQKGFLPRYLPIVQRTSALIAKAQRLRVERDFSGAAQSLAASQQIVELGATLSETQTLVDYLEHVKGISLTRTEMEATIGRFDKVFSRCCSHVRFGEIRDLYKDVIRIQSEAKNLKEAHDDKTAELERAAEREWRKLEGQWQALQGIASLRSDLLASNFNSLLQKRSAIPGKPVLLQQFNQEVARLACRMQEVHSGLRKQMLAANLRINNLKAEAFRIDLMSTKWSCLAPFAAHIRSGVSNTKDMLSDIRHLTTYDEVISKFRSIRSELKELEQVYGRMSDQCGRLNKMEGIVKACTQLLENEDWKDRTESVRRRISVILQQLQNSKRDPQLDQAYAYLQNAHDAVWELVATLPPADVKRYTVIIEGGPVYGLNIGDRPTIYQSFGLSSIL